VIAESSSAATRRSCSDAASSAPIGAVRMSEPFPAAWDPDLSHTILPASLGDSPAATTESELLVWFPMSKATSDQAT
jgi:hypothetical protein